MVKVLAHRTSSPHQGFGHAPAAPSSYMSTVPSSCIKLRRYLPQNHLTLRAAGAENLHRYATATVAAAALNTTNARSPAMQHPAAALRYAELFCGLGAFSYALHRALAACGAPPPQLVAAADVDQVAGQVYAHNHGAVPSNTDLSRVDATRLDAWGAHLWCLSPPCQPYTRTTSSKQRDAGDTRASALLNLTNQLPRMHDPPLYLILENVPGFAESESRRRWVGTLTEEMGYGVQEFELSPVQLGVPNLRARYFALAKAPGLAFARMGYTFARATDTLSQRQQHHQHAGSHGVQQQGPGHVHKEPPTLPSPVAERVCPRMLQQQQQQRQAAAQQQASGQSAHLQEPQHARIPAGTEDCWPLRLFLEEPYPPAQLPVQHQQEQQCQQPSQDAGAGNTFWQRHGLPWEKLIKFWKVLDVVTPASRHTNCFTKSYSKNLIASGSVLASPAFVDAFCRLDERGRLHLPASPVDVIAAAQGDAAARHLREVAKEIRFMSPREIANLHGLPPSPPDNLGSFTVHAPMPSSSFSWTCSDAQMYSLLGNSMSADVVALLLTYMLHNDVGMWEKTLQAGRTSVLLEP